MESDSPRFAVGQTVCLKASTGVVGVVVEVATGGAEPRYTVFHDGSRRPYYESQLAAVEIEERRAVVDASELHARLSATHITQPGISSLYTLHAGRIDFVPYQFRPVLKLIRADRPRLLIADEVGVGKTIEAGLILRELQARQDLGRVLIVCSKSLIAERKWETEMRRFDEEFTPLDGPLLRHCLDQTDLDGDWPERYSRVLLPFSLFSENLLYGEEATRRRGRRVGLLDLDPPPRFDLVIVDEAHHLRNQETYVHQGMRFLADNANAVIFLTATPLQMGDQDLFVLLNMLRPDYVLDPVVFEHMSGPNGPINRAVEKARNARIGWNAEAVRDLEAAASTDWGQVTLRPNPEFQSLIEILSGPDVPDPDRVRAIRQMEEFHSFSSLINRTRRRDIGQFTTRKPVTQTVPFTPEQQALHDAVLRTQASILAQLHADTPIGFLMTTIRRQAASCLHGLAPLLREILTRRFDDLELSEIDPEFVGIDTSSVESIRQEVESVLEHAARLPAEDPKWSRLDSVLTEKRALANRRVLVFSSFRHTLAYLERKIRESGHRAGVIHGDTPDEDRRELRRRFALGHEDADAVEVLLCSEVGSEGLDYQFCDCIVNYDLPWNPMRIEQRIGRIDRYGQQSEAVAIHNLVTPGTVDFDIYDRCLVRLGIFREAIGGSEEILGRITTELRRIAEDLTLSDQERRAQLQQMADNEIRALHEQAGLEEGQLELFGVQLPQDEFAADVERARNPWLEPWALRNLIETYARTAFGVAQPFTSEGPQTHLRLNAEARQELLRATHESGRATTLVEREWRQWLKSGTATAPVAFDRSSAAANRSTMFITPAHPLVRIAARALASDESAVTYVRVKNDDLPSGEHHFFIYLWHVRGVRDTAEFRVVCDSEMVEAALPELLRGAETCAGASVDGAGGSEFEVLEARHHELWSTRRAAHMEETEELVEYRLSSLRTSHAARTEIIREQIAQATDARIRRMREAELSNAEREHVERVQNLEAQATAADVLARPVAFGVVQIEGTDG